VPFTLDHNRMIVEVELRRPDGTLRQAKAWVDTGSENLSVSEALARELGLQVPTFQRPGSAATSPSPAPGILVGGLPLQTAGLTVQVMAGTVVRAGVPADLNLPAKALRGLHVVFDYSARRLTLAPPGALKPRGTPLPCQVHPVTGLFQIVASVEGAPLNLAVDNGAAGTWISEAQVQAWKRRHPRWPSAGGAAGSANFFGFPFESAGTLLRLPEMTLGPFRVKGVGLLGLSPGVVDWYSQKTAAPVQGFIGANVLKGFRLEVDFPGQMTYWTPAERVDPECFSMVGLTLRPMADGILVVAGVVTTKGRPSVEGVKSGDSLTRVGSLEVAGVPMGAVIEALRGRPGETRNLVLERQGRTLIVRAKIRRLI
jgi:hypothetical protein